MHALLKVSYLNNFICTIQFVCGGKQILYIFSPSYLLIDLFFFMQSIEMSHNGRVDECFVAMLEAWFKKGSPSWSVMVEALRGPSVERGDLADVIEKEFILSLLPRSLTLTVISTVLQRVRAKWFELGVALGLPDETLQVIEGHAVS